MITFTTCWSSFLLILCSFVIAGDIVYFYLIFAWICFVVFLCYWSPCMVWFCSTWQVWSKSETTCYIQSLKCFFVAWQETEGGKGRAVTASNVSSPEKSCAVQKMSAVARQQRKLMQLFCDPLAVPASQGALWQDPLCHSWRQLFEGIYFFLY